MNNFYFWTPAATGDTFQSEQWSDNLQGNYEQDWNTYRQTSFTQRLYDENSGIVGFSAPWSDAYQKVYSVNLGIRKLNLPRPVRNTQESTAGRMPLLSCLRLL